MKLKYNRMFFGRKKNRITFVHLNKPWKLGLAGMVTSPLFEDKIAVAVDDTPMEESDYDYACLACNRDGGSPRIMMTSRVFYDIKRGHAEARTILLHELGHYWNKDISPGKCTDQAQREHLVVCGSVSEAELRADAFAVAYLGRETVIAGLSALKERILRDYANHDMADIELTVKELDARITYLMKNERGIDA